MLNLGFPAVVIIEYSSIMSKILSYVSSFKWSHYKDTDSKTNDSKLELLEELSRSLNK